MVESAILDDTGTASPQVLLSSTPPVAMTIRDRGWVFLLTLAFAGISYYLHISTDSMFMWTAADWDHAVELHGWAYPFCIRPFTTHLVRWLHEATGIGLGVSFQLVQFVGFLLLGQAFADFLMALGFRKSYVIAGMVMLFTAYPVLCAFFQPVYTWDDFWPYALVPLSFAQVLRGRVLAGAVSLTLAMFGRETTVLMYPVFVLLLIANPPARRWRMWLGLAIPVVIYGAYWLYVPHPKDPDLLHQFAMNNFFNASWASSSVFSLIISFGFLWMTTAVAMVTVGAQAARHSRYSFLTFGTMVLLPAFVLMTMLFARMRETRLFFPPFVFMIPLTLLWVQTYWPMTRRLLRWWYAVPAIVVVVGAVYAGQVLERVLFYGIDVRPWQPFVQWYLGAHFAIAGVVALVIVGWMFFAAFTKRQIS